MLETTLATRFVPGSNVKGDVAGANWRFFLPSLELERVACIGRPSPASLRALSGLAHDVVSAPAGIDDPAVAALPDGSVDLAVVAGRNGARRLARDASLQAELGRLLRPGGTAYAEASGAGPQRFAVPIASIARRIGEHELVWLAPPGGEVRVGAPAADRKAIGFLLRHVREDSGVRRRPVERLRRYVAWHPMHARLSPRYGVLVSKDQERGGLPPLYLARIAEAAGLDLAGWRWAFSAPGRYSSKKALFFLFDAEEQAPRCLAKITRDQGFNTRLENEHRALTLLEERGFGGGGALPRAVFLGHHGGLAVVGETVVEGVPLRLRSFGDSGSPWLAAALEWILELGAATADGEAARPAEVAAGLESLLEQFVAIYRVAPAERELLAGSIAAIGRSDQRFPLVFQHGDPGAWNALVTPAGEVAFLDWEAAEPAGMPLWDLFYFVRSFAPPEVGPLRSRRPFPGDPVLGDRLAEVIDAYCLRVRLARELVGPLFYTCWMHRALKEATRLPPNRLESGRFVNLLRRCIEEREAPALRRLLSPPIAP